MNIENSRFYDFRFYNLEQNSQKDACFFQELVSEHDLRYELQIAHFHDMLAINLTGMGDKTCFQRFRHS